MKWLLLNAKQRARRMIANPGYAAQVVFREATWSDERFLSRVTGKSAGSIRRFLDEPANTPEFMQRLAECESTFRATKIESADLYAKKVLVQYATVRAVCPDIVVETGIANGVSSAHLLLALHKNGRGTLHSIEVGDSTYLPPGHEPGWIVPDWLRSRWQVHIGDSKQLLPELLRDLQSIDLFAHDSLHTYDHMMFEFEQAYPHVRPGGVLVADDALWNESFRDFSRKIQSPHARILHGVGVMKKGVCVKILIYTHAFAPETGGVERIVMSLAQGLSQLRAECGRPMPEVTVVTPTAARGMDDGALPFRVVRQPGLGQLVRLLLDADIVHLAGPALLPLVLARILRKRTVVEHHGFQTVCPNGQLLHEPSQTFCPGHFMAQRHLECLRCNAKLGMIASLRMWLLTFPRRHLCEQIAANVCPTAWLETVLRLPRSKTIAHGLPAKSSLPIGERARPATFVFVGRLVGTKGVGVLLTAAQKLNDSGRIFQVVIIGDGPDRPTLEAQTRNTGLGDSVRFVGRLADDRMEELMASAAAVVMPSLAGEVFGLVAVESMLRGQLVIAADIGALGEVVGGAGLTFAAGDAGQLAECMRIVLDEPTLADELGEKARKHSLAVFTQNQMAEDHVVLFRHVTGFGHCTC